MMLGLALSLSSPSKGGGAAPVAPSTLAALPMYPVQVLGTGNVQMDRTAGDACRVWNAALYANNVEWAGVTNQATFDSWLQTRSESYARITTNTTIPLNNDQGLRSTHASQSAGQRVKHLIADGCVVTLTITAPATDVNALSYALDGGGSDVYLATMVSAAFPHRMFRTDQTDAWGKPKPLRKYTTLAALQAAGSGWFRTGTSLYVKMGGNVETQKGLLAAKWMDTGGNSRLFISGSILCLEAINGGSIVLDGVQVALIEAGTPARRPQIWRHKVRQQWNFGLGVSSLSPFGGMVVDSECTVFSSEQDGINLSAASVNTGIGLIVTANNRFIDTGSVDASGQNGTLQAISAHGGVDHASFGTTGAATNAPAIADTCATGTASTTWLVACASENPAETLDRGFLFGSGSGGTRAVYMDRCVSTGATTDLVVDTGATVRTSNCNLPVISGSTTPYDPATPG